MNELIFVYNYNHIFSGKNIRLRWIITRSPAPTNTTIEEAMKPIGPNAQDLLVVNQSNCPPGF